MAKCNDSKKDEAIRLLADGVYDCQKISDSLGIPRTTLWRWRKDPEFQEKVRELNKVTFLESSARAIRRLTEIMESKNDAAAVAACREILKLAGYDAPLRVQAEVESKNLNINVNIEE